MQINIPLRWNPEFSDSGLGDVEKIFHNSVEGTPGMNNGQITSITLVDGKSAIVTFSLCSSGGSLNTNEIIEQGRALLHSALVSVYAFHLH